MMNVGTEFIKESTIGSGLPAKPDDFQTGCQMAFMTDVSAGKYKLSLKFILLAFVSYPADLH